MPLTVDKTFGSRKAEVLSYLRSRASEHLSEVTRQFGVHQFRKRAAAINRVLAEEKQTLASMIRQVAEREKWGPQSVLGACCS